MGKMDREELQKAIQEIQEILKKVGDDTIKGAKAMKPMTGISHMMAHPAEPWPYGTVLRRSDAPKSTIRGMWIGNNLIQPIAGFLPSKTNEPHEIRPGLWEPVEDTLK